MSEAKTPSGKAKVAALSLMDKDLLRKVSDQEVKAGANASWARLIFGQTMIDTLISNKGMSDAVLAREVVALTGRSRSRVLNILASARAYNTLEGIPVNIIAEEAPSTAMLTSDLHLLRVAAYLTPEYQANDPEAVDKVKKVIDAAKTMAGTKRLSEKHLSAALKAAGLKKAVKASRAKDPTAMLVQSLNKSLDKLKATFDPLLAAETPPELDAKAKKVVLSIRGYLNDVEDNLIKEVRS